MDTKHYIFVCEGEIVAQQHQEQPAAARVYARVLANQLHKRVLAFEYVGGEDPEYTEAEIEQDRLRRWQQGQEPPA